MTVCESEGRINTASESLPVAKNSRAGLAECETLRGNEKWPTLWEVGRAMTQMCEDSRCVPTTRQFVNTHSTGLRSSGAVTEKPGAPVESEGPHSMLNISSTTLNGHQSASFKSSRYFSFILFSVSVGMVLVMEMLSVMWMAVS